jgi:hypothetical protein
LPEEHIQSNPEESVSSIQEIVGAINEIRITPEELVV